MINFTPNLSCAYKYDYEQIFRDVANGHLEEAPTFKQLVLDDLFFILYFVVGNTSANKPFVVERCKQVEQDPDTNMLYVWAREHFKSSIITISQTLQRRLRDPNGSSAIISYTRPIAKNFLFVIMNTLERSELLKKSFPDIVYENPRSQAPRFSLDEGIFLKCSTIKNTATFEAWGLVEGMPTSKHADDMTYDDVVTQDMVQNPEMMETVKLKIDASINLGTDQGKHRFVGTYYHHNDPLIYVGNKTDANGIPLYQKSIISGSDDGTINGNPVLISLGRWGQLKQTKTFACQQLCNPTPLTEQKIHLEQMQPIKRTNIPLGTFSLMIVDPAGDAATNKSVDSDAWSIMSYAIEPTCDDMGLANIYITQAYIDKLDESQAVELIARMYMQAGLVLQLGYEKFSNTTPAVASHVVELLKKRGRHLDEKDGSFKWLKPAGRHKVTKILNALQWPINNNKWFYCDDIPSAYIERLKQEATYFPLWHDDGLDNMSYVYDMLREGTFYFAGANSKAFEIPEMGII